MNDLLYLVHRIPWPPNKGDKIRSHHILLHLAKHFRVHLGTFIDDPADRVYLPELEKICASVCVRPLPPIRTKLRALTGLLTGEPLTLPWYRDAALRRWVERTLHEKAIRQAFVFSSTMAQYLPDNAELTRIVDFVDVDSDKWTQYAATKRWPMSAVYRREGRKLLEYERRIASRSNASLFVSAAEAASFREWAPESSDRVHWMNNGVDATYFAPEAAAAANPYPEGATVIVFTGAMDYWPNVDAVTWFAETVLPLVRNKHPDVRFYIVGNRPAPQVQALTRLAQVTVTGFVEDMRPWIRHATLAVAPLRIARGVQNKVLEAMALARPVIATPQALEGLTAQPGRELLLAEPDSVTFAEAVSRQLSIPDNNLGSAARARILADYDWERNLDRIQELLLEPGQCDTRATAEGTIHEF